MLKIRVLDDRIQNEAQSVDEILKAVAEAGVAADVKPCEEETRKALVAQVELMRKKHDGADAEWLSDPSEWISGLSSLSDVDVLFLDYQLPELADHGWLTAEDLAGLLRAFSGVAFVVVLNRFQERDFDLSMKPVQDTAADLHMNARFLQNSGLWRDPDPSDQSYSQERFRPWLWPDLSRVVEDVKTCLETIGEVSLDGKILEFFDFDNRRAGSLSREDLGALNPDSKDPENTTFSEFLRYGCVSVDSAVRAYLLDHLGDPTFRRAADRILVSELRRWLGDRVMAAQEALIDAPHLAQRMPWIIEGDISNIATWNACAAHDGGRCFKQGLVEEAFKFEKEYWLPRVAYWTADLQASSLIDDAYMSFEEAAAGDFVFQEDFSRFSPESECEEYTSAFNSIWSNRYVSSVGVDGDEIRYAPKVRLL